MSNNPGILYIVATPIGNLADISQRAIATLGEVDLVVAEDTRHSKKLFNHYGISTALQSLHEHNERAKAKAIVAELLQGQSIALISDAGTPLVSDPGYHLVQAAQQADIVVCPIPGACAAITALSASGLASDRFTFEGFPPAKKQARKAFYRLHQDSTQTLIFYESPHRIIESLEDMVDSFGDGRTAVVARELTKKFETIKKDTLQNLLEWVKQDKEQPRGEYVVLIHGAEKMDHAEIDVESERILQLLLAELPVKKASSLAAQITGIKKNKLYAYAIDHIEK